MVVLLPVAAHGSGDHDGVVRTLQYVCHSPPCARRGSTASRAGVAAWIPNPMRSCVKSGRSAPSKSIHSPRQRAAAAAQPTRLDRQSCRLQQWTTGATRHAYELGTTEEWFSRLRRRESDSGPRRAARAADRPRARPLRHRRGASTVGCSTAAARISFTTKWISNAPRARPPCGPTMSGRWPETPANRLIVRAAPADWRDRTLLVPGAGFEPARPFGQRILSPLRLPFRHPGRTPALP